MATLVTCATGFVSRAFVRAFQNQGERVHALIRDPAKASLFPAAEVFIGDLFDPATVSAAIQGVDTVIHVPPRVYPAGSREVQIEMHRRAHVESTRLVLEQAVSQGVEKFLFVSSAHATGRDPELALCETAGNRPLSPYGQAKREAEDLALSFGTRHPLDVVIARPPGIYGPGDKSLVSWMRRLAAHNLWLPVRGLEVYYSLVFVDNLARAGLALLKLPRAGSELRVFIVKDPVDYRPEDIYAAICRTLGKRVMLLPASVFWLRTLGALGDLGRRIPKLRGLAAFKQLTSSQMYCGHRLNEALPNLALVDFEAAIGETFKAAAPATI